MTRCDKLIQLTCNHQHQSRCLNKTTFYVSLDLILYFRHSQDHEITQNIPEIGWNAQNTPPKSTIRDISTTKSDMDQDEEESSRAVLGNPEHVQSSTLLPSPIATIISLVTRSSSLYLRLGTFIGGLALDGARVTTLTGLELSRALIEGILNRAG